MATFLNDLRLKEIATGDESGTWGTSTNANLALIADAFSLGTKDMAGDADETFTMPDAVADGVRSLYLKITSAVSLTATRTVTLAPNTVSKLWIIENATSGAQSITISQGSGGTVTIATGQKVMVVTDGAGAGAAVVNANPITDLASQVTGTLPVANGGTGVTSSTGTGNVVLSNSPTLVTPALGTPSALVGTNITGTAAGLTAGNVTTNANLTGAVTSVGNATSLGSFSSANLAGALTDETGTGAAVFANSPTLVTPALGTPASGVVTNLTGTASININGTVGATTPSTGVFTAATVAGIDVANALTLGAVAAFTWDSSTVSPASSVTREVPPFVLSQLYDQIKGCVLNADGTVNYYLKATDWSEKADGTASDLTGADGNVMVEIPKFYFRTTFVGTVTTWEISPIQVSGFTLHPAFILDGVEVDKRYYSAYDACVSKTQAITGATAANPVVITSNNHGLQTGDTCFIDGVVGMTEINDRTFTVTRVDANEFSLDDEDGTLYVPYVSGGTFDAYIGGANNNDSTALVNTATDKLSSVKGVYPMVGLARTELRLLAAVNGTGWRQLDFYLWCAVGMLYVVEYQTFFNQSVLGNGNTNGSYLDSSEVQSDSPHTIAGLRDDVGNGSTTSANGQGTATNPGTVAMKYRGIENLFGNCWNWADAINVNVTATGNVHLANGNDRANYADDTATDHTLITSSLTTSSANIQALLPLGPYFLAAATGGTDAQYVTDRHFGSAGSNRVARVGGAATSGGGAGVFTLSAVDATGARLRTIGGRLAK
jgi:hypothetical protein